MYFALIVLGLILGSFVNALVWRLHEQSKYYDEDGRLKKLSGKEKKRLNDLSITKGRSMCSKCGHQLSALDLVPILSWVALRGRCRYCHEKIDDAPIVELALPLLLVVSYVFWPFQLQGTAGYALFAVWVLMMTCFVALAAYDARWFLLPDRVVFPLIALAVSFVVLRVVQYGDLTRLYEAVFAGAVLSGLFLLLFLVSKGTWIVFGDVKLAIALGLIVGSPLMSLLVVFVASLSGTVMALPQMISGGEGLKRSIPFGPHLLLATIIVFLFGQTLIDWYLSLLLL